MRAFRITLGMLAIGLVASASFAQFEKGASAPAIEAVDINGNAVDISAITAQENPPYLLIMFFFTPDSGEAVVKKLRALHDKYGDEKLKIVALGVEQDKPALEDFARRMGIHYQVVAEDQFADSAWHDQLNALPLTLFVETSSARRIEQILSGGGESNAHLLKEVAELFYRQRREAALEVADMAIADGEDAQAAQEIKGFYFADTGRLDEAEEAFGAIDSKTGLAAVALERGQYDNAVALAEQAPAEDGLAKTIAGEAQLYQGNLDAAAESLKAGAETGGSGWEESRNRNSQGRLAHAQGDYDAALNDYEAAVALDGYNIIPLANEAAAYRERGAEGDLEKAEASLTKAQAIRDDAVVTAMLEQIAREQAQANDLARQELIRNQINDLKAQYDALKAGGESAANDAWSTRPLVMALLTGKEALFERAGLDVVIQRELETRLNADDRVSVVERAMLDKLLQELSLGSSDLASADTQRRLGQVLSAGYLGFLDFVRTGGDVMLYVRLVDTETTSLFFQGSYAVNENAPFDAVEKATAEILAATAAGHTLQGLIADASQPDAIVINVGERHGVAVGQQFTVFVEGDPIEVGGRVIAHRQKPAGKLEVTQVEDTYAVCQTLNVQEGVTLAKGQKIKQSP